MTAGAACLPSLAPPPGDQNPRKEPIHDQHPSNLAAVQSRPGRGHRPHRRRDRRPGRQPGRRPARVELEEAVHLAFVRQPGADAELQAEAELEAAAS